MALTPPGYRSGQGLFVAMNLPSLEQAQIDEADAKPRQALSGPSNPRSQVPHLSNLRPRERVAVPTVVLEQGEEEAAHQRTAGGPDPADHRPPEKE